ncbi:hypothetical protein DAEQUDRAFT_447926 [Daedalea quercina L-15889]|uniref:Uncharacterized protein n=1 Tax=Daedalea quercina L-15889 TaxID=1314783 RepID=A0A165N5T6_9APHY|nr:hypothetical protein DAEQUDRAFT_447926 [Daedalea quercina L-15889]
MDTPHGTRRRAHPYAMPHADRFPTNDPRGRPSYSRLVNQATPPTSPPIKTPFSTRKAKATRRGDGHPAQRALEKDRKGQERPTVITEEEAVEILAVYSDPSVDDVVFGKPLNQYDLDMANEVAMMHVRKSKAESLHDSLFEAGLRVHRAKNSSRAQRWRQHSSAYLARMKRELGSDPLREFKRREEEERRLAEIARLNELHKQSIEEARRKREEEQRLREEERWRCEEEERKREERKRRAEAKRNAREARRREKERLRAEAHRQQEDRRKQEEERARQLAEALQLYDSKWETLKSLEAPTDIPGQLMPWPVFHEVTMPEHITYEAVKEFVLHPLRSSVSEMSSKKKVMAELLRWHSDKFDKIALLKVRLDHQEVAKQCASLVERWLTRLLMEVQA